MNETIIYQGNGDDGTRTRNHRIDNPVPQITKPLINQHETHGAKEAMARHGALSMQNDDRLDELVKAWPALPEAIKAGIAALVQAAKAP